MGPVPPGPGGQRASRLRRGNQLTCPVVIEDSPGGEELTGTHEALQKPRADCHTCKSPATRSSEYSLCALPGRVGHRRRVIPYR